MYKWTLRHRNSNEANILNPEKVVDGYAWVEDAPVVNANYFYSELLPVIPSQFYQLRGNNTDFILKYISFYDENKVLGSAFIKSAK